MAQNKTTSEILATVLGLLSEIGVGKYLWEKPTNTIADEYIVLNSLPTQPGPMQKCYVNINYHVRDLGEGIPDGTKLEAGAKAVLDILEEVSTTDYLIDFESQEDFSEPDKKEHFTNLRFSFKQINR